MHWYVLNTPTSVKVGLIINGTWVKPLYGESAAIKLMGTSIQKCVFVVFTLGMCISTLSLSVARFGARFGSRLHQ